MAAVWYFALALCPSERADSTKMGFDLDNNIEKVFKLKQSEVEGMMLYQIIS